MSFTPIIDELASRGFALQEHFLPDDMTRDLALECRRREREGILSPAGVGRGESMAVMEGIRGDWIDWLEPGQSAISDRYLGIMDDLRLALNQAFFLGLEEFECHFALYPPGAFYKTHLDRFRDDDSRTVTAVLYLNHDWQPAHGGEMRMHLPQGRLDVAPVAGCLAVFMSAEIPHEVLPTNVERMAMTGWFRRRALQPF